MQLPALLLVTLLCLDRPASAQGVKLDEILSTPQQLNDIKSIGLILTSQTDPNVAEKNARDLRKTHWALSPRAMLPPPDAELALKIWDAEWDRVFRVIEERKITQVSFAGVDLVMLRKAQDWYYAAATPRGPVLMRVSIQYNDGAPMTVHGIRVWTDWDHVKYVSERIHIPAADKPLTITYEKSKSASTTPEKP